MRRSYQLVSQLAFASVIASPAFPAPPAEADAAIERKDWVQRSWRVESPWGPRQRCRHVWVQPRNDD
jgi:hypothetical protein